jgi:hypothetical protein
MILSRRGDCVRMDERKRVLNSSIYPVIGALIVFSETMQHGIKNPKVNKKSQRKFIGMKRNSGQLYIFAAPNGEKQLLCCANKAAMEA